MLTTTPAEGDIVLLRPTRDPDNDGILTKPLQPDHTIHTHRGTLLHSSIIGRRVREVVATSKGINYRLHEPTLAEYVRLTPRLVTPIYPGDANLIVSLLDLHVAPPAEGSQDAPPLEILEAGTGHGALTLHLARAIHAANPPTPLLPPPDKPQRTAHPSRDSTTLESTTAPPSAPADEPSIDDPAQAATHTAYATWKRSRRAILHTLDVARPHSRHARNVVRGFRRGLYSPSVDFHVGDVSAFVAAQLAARAAPESSGTPAVPAAAEGLEATPAGSGPFLSAAFLDLPGAHAHLEVVGRGTRVDGAVMVFAPSVTQIVDCVREIREKALPLQLERVVELGMGLSNGRLWDVRGVKARAAAKASGGKGKQGGESSAKRRGNEVEGKGEGGDEGETKVEGVADELIDERMAERDEEQAEAMKKSGDEWVMVCRPKVGEAIVGGGFLGVWRKLRESSSTDS